ncbi:MAG: hypothetical protein ACLFRB_06700 [Thiohalorhabdus sp.]|uniref:hypothetical protein n=1 Tax=Thiohalorhabdus sp. TaxID=3094134 RepID=UPI00397F1338
MSYSTAISTAPAHPLQDYNLSVYSTPEEAGGKAVQISVMGPNFLLHLTRDQAHELSEALAKHVAVHDRLHAQKAAASQGRQEEMTQ